MSQPTVSTEQTLSNLGTTGKVKVPCHPCHLYLLRWQRQTDPQDHGGQGEQEGAPSEQPSEEKKKNTTNNDLITGIFLATEKPLK